MAELTQETTNLNNGVPFKDYENPIIKSGSTKNDIFYTSLLTSDKDNSPVDVYQRLQQETLAKGFSLAVEEAKIKWSEEQDFLNASTLQNIIEDSNIEISIKKDILDSYINTGIVSTDLKDSVMKKMSDQYILDNNLDENNAAIEEVDLVVNKFKVEQAVQKLKDNIKVNGSNTANITVETAIKQAEKIVHLIGGKVREKSDLAKFLDTKPPGYNYGIEAELVYWKDMIVGKGPEWIQTMTKILMNRLRNAVITSESTRLEILQTLIPSTYLAQLGLEASDEVDKRTWTELRKDIEEEQKTGWTREWSEDASAALEDLGYSPRLLQEATLSGLVINTLGEFFHFVGETYAKDDPQSIIVPLEILTPFLFYGAARSIDKIGRTREKRKGEIHKPATDIHREAVRAENKRQQDIAAAKELARQKKENILPPPENKGTIIPSEKIAVKSTDPIAVVTLSNKKAGAELIDHVITDETGEIGEAVGLTRNKLIAELTNPGT